MEITPFEINKKAPVPESLGQEPDSCGTTRIHLPFAADALFPRTLTIRASWITGEVPVAPTAGIPGSVCPLKSIPRNRHRRNPTVCGSLCMPDFPRTRLDRRFILFVISIYDKKRFVNTPAKNFPGVGCSRGLCPAEGGGKASKWAHHPCAHAARALPFFERRKEAKTSYEAIRRQKTHACDAPTPVSLREPTHCVNSR